MATLILLTELFLYVCFPAVAAVPAQDKTHWRIEKEYKFQLGYYRSDEENARLQSEFGTSLQKAAPLDLQGPGIPELDISVKMSLDRGFSLPVKGNPSELTYYMKFFRYPVGLNAAVSAGSMVNAFLLNHSSRGRDFNAFVESSNNVIVKVGLIRHSGTSFKSKPFPSFILPPTPSAFGDETLSPQEFFDSGLFYSTVAISSPSPAAKAADDQSKINASVVGLHNFLRDMIEVYASSFYELEPVNKNASERYFVSREACIGSVPEECRLVVYRIPKEVLIFKDARSKPRPLGPKESFASGFAMIQRTEYYHANSFGTFEIPTLSELNTKWKRGPVKILEAVSLVQL